MTLFLILGCILFPIVGIFWTVYNFSKTGHVFLSALSIGIAAMVISKGFRALDGDLTRYIPYIELYRGLSIEDSFNLAYSRYPLATMWFWASAQTGDAYVAQYSAVFINYFCLTYIIFDMCSRYMFTTVQVFLVVATTIVLFPFANTTSALRSTPSMAFGMLGLYLFVFKGRQYFVLAWMLAVASCLVHAAGYVVVFLMAATPLLRKRRVALSLATGLAVVPSVLVFGTLLRPITSTLNVDIVEKLIGYNEWSTEWRVIVANSGYYTALKNLHMALCVLLAVDAIRESARVSYSSDESDYNSFLVVMLLLLGIELGFALFVPVPTYLRFSFAVCPFVSVFICAHLPYDAKPVKCRWEIKSKLLLRGAYTTALMGLFLLYIYGARRIVAFSQVILSLFFGIISVVFG